MTLSNHIHTKGIKNNCLNEIQVLAALLVIYNHSFYLGQGEGGDILYGLLNGRWQFGTLSVACFFILSGFFCSQSYLRGNSFFQYVKKRIIRIFPAMILVIIFCVFIMGPLVTTYSVKDYFLSAETWNYLTGIWPYPLKWNLPGVFETNAYSSSVNGSIWTIPYQLIMYMVLGLMGICGLLRKKNFVFGCFMMTIFVNLCQNTLFADVNDYFLTLPIKDWCYLSIYFMAGVAANAFADQIILSRVNAVIALIVLAFAWYGGEYIISTSILGTYLLLYLGYSDKLKLKFLKPVSSLSYGIYVFAWPIQQLLVWLWGGRMNAYLNTILAIPISIIFAWISWVLVEKRMMRLRNVYIIENMVTLLLKKK